MKSSAYTWRLSFLRTYVPFSCFLQYFIHPYHEMSYIPLIRIPVRLQ